LEIILYVHGLKHHLPQKKKGRVLAYSSSIFKFSVSMISVTEAGAKTSLTIAPDFVWPQDFL
jgi:hypothetical protein